jgi:hypothetical protein
MITIHWDFSDGTEISYVEGLNNNNFTTHCLEFFSFDIDVNDVIVLREDGKYISRASIQKHTNKEIREEHNIRKMLLAGNFEWL